jgi:hypothetical protein
MPGFRAILASGIEDRGGQSAKILKPFAKHIDELVPIVRAPRHRYGASSAATALPDQQRPLRFLALTTGQVLVVGPTYQSRHRFLRGINSYWRRACPRTHKR